MCKVCPSSTPGTLYGSLSLPRLISRCRVRSKTWPPIIVVFKQTKNYCQSGSNVAATDPCANSFDNRKHYLYKLKHWILHFNNHRNCTAIIIPKSVSMK